MNASDQLGTEPIGKLLIKQSVPAAIGFLVMSINGIVDGYFVGNYIGSDAFGAVTSITPIMFLFASFGMAVGIGGSSVLSRALGANDKSRAKFALNNQITILAICILLTTSIGLLFGDVLVEAFGAKDGLFDFGYSYFNTLLFGIPFLTVAMMLNNNIRAEGRATIAALILLLPSVFNMILDYIFIDRLGGGIVSAAWATNMSFILSAGLGFYFYLSGRSEVKFSFAHLKIQKLIVKEISAIGSVSLIRQSAIAVLMVVLAKSLHHYGAISINPETGGEIAFKAFSNASVLSLLAFFPLIGISQGFMPICSYNFGAKQYDRVKEVIKLSMIWGIIIGAIMCALLLYFSGAIPALFLKDNDPDIIKHGSDAIFYYFMATPLVAIPLIGSSYFQAIGKAIPAMLLTLTKQAFTLVPIVLILPLYYGLNGIWYSFVLADLLTALICFLVIRKVFKTL